MICPKDLRPCIDDLCYGGGCIEMDGAPMYYKCSCGQLVSDDDMDNCLCEPDESYCIDEDGHEIR